MTAWEQSVNRELSDLNDAHSAARIDTPEYRRRRRALLNATLRQEGTASHTLRRPAAAVSLSIRASRDMPTRRAMVRSRRNLRSLVWWLGAAVVSVGAVVWLALFPPF
jgi:hypothetical protein